MQLKGIVLVTSRGPWDQLIGESEAPTVYHTWEWKTFLEKRGFQSRYVLVKDSLQNLQAGCAFVLTPYLRFFRRYNSLPYYGMQGGGPLFRKDGNKQNVCESLNNWLRTVSLSARVVGSRVVTTDEETRRFLEARGMLFQAKRGFMIADLEKTPPETIWEKVFSNREAQRTVIRRLEHMGLEMRVVADRSAFQDFEMLHRDSLVRLRAHIPPESFYNDLWETLGPKYLQIGIVSLTGKTLCAFIFLPFARRRTVDLFLIGYDRETLRNLSMPLFVIWSMIEWAGENGYRFVNLGGTPNNPADKHYRFKAQFGCSMIPCYDMQLIPHPRLLKVVQKAMSWTGREPEQS
jgi:lipid II:glycine glycyltransferase (peptidoglycan interpeptide bridge formation enzyme)